MKYTPLTKERVLPFLQELKTRCDLGHKVSICQLAEGMGMTHSAAFSKALISNGHVKMLGAKQDGLYKCQYNLSDGFVNHFITLVRDVKKQWKANKEKKQPKKNLTPINDTLLSRFTDKQLTAELKARGFTGSMKKSVEFKF